MKYNTGIEMTEPPFDIRERTFVFAMRVIKLVKRFPRTLDAMEIGRQLLRSGTSIGANVEEAIAQKANVISFIRWGLPARKHEKQDTGCDL